MALSFAMLGILLVLAVLIMAVGVKFLVKIFIKFMPKDVQEKVYRMPDNPKWMTALGICLMIIFLSAVVFLLIWAGVDAVHKNYGFGMIFLRFLILLEGYKIFDMIVFDWLLLTKSNIPRKWYPEIADCEVFHSYGYNLKNQIIKLFVFAMLAAGIALGLNNI